MQFRTRALGFRRQLASARLLMVLFRHLIVGAGAFGDQTTWPGAIGD